MLPQLPKVNQQKLPYSKRVESALESRFEIIPVVVGPVYRIKQRKAGFFSVEEDLEKDAGVALASKEDQLDICSHGHAVGLEPGCDLVRIGRVVSHTVDIEYHQKGQERVIVAETQVSSFAALCDPCVRLIDDVVQDRSVAHMCGPGVAVELEIVDFP